jgi:hypothetical protein
MPEEEAVSQGREKIMLFVERMEIGKIGIKKALCGAQGFLEFKVGIA